MVQGRLASFASGFCCRRQIREKNKNKKFNTIFGGEGTSSRWQTKEAYKCTAAAAVVWSPYWTTQPLSGSEVGPRRPQCPLANGKPKTFTKAARTTIKTWLGSRLQGRSPSYNSWQEKAQLRSWVKIKWECQSTCKFGFFNFKLVCILFFILKTRCLSWTMFLFCFSISERQYFS